MNTKNLISFIRFGYNPKISGDKFVLGSIGIFALCILTGAICIFGDDSSMFTLVCSCVALMLSVFLLIAIVLLSRNITFIKRIACYAVSNISIAVILTVNAFAFLYMGHVAYASLIFLLPFALGTVSSIICYSKCRRGKYVNKKNNPLFMNVAVFAAAGAAFGRIFDIDIPAETIPYALQSAILLAIVASLFAITGAPMALRLYYLKKLEEKGIQVSPE